MLSASRTHQAFIADSDGSIIGTSTTQSYEWKEKLGTHVSDKDLAQILRKSVRTISHTTRFASRDPPSRHEKVAINVAVRLEVPPAIASRVKARFANLEIKFVRENVLIAAYLSMLEDEHRHAGRHFDLASAMQEFEINSTHRRKAKELIWKCRKNGLFFAPKVYTREQYLEAVCQGVICPREIALARELVFNQTLPHIPFEKAIKLMKWSITKLLSPEEFDTDAVDREDIMRFRKYVSNRARPAFVALLAAETKASMEANQRVHSTETHLQSSTMSQSESSLSHQESIIEQIVEETTHTRQPRIAKKPRPQSVSLVEEGLTPRLSSQIDSNSCLTSPSLSTEIEGSRSDHHQLIDELGEGILEFIRTHSIQPVKLRLGIARSNGLGIVLRKRHHGDLGQHWNRGFQAPLGALWKEGIAADDGAGQHNVHSSSDPEQIAPIAVAVTGVENQ